MSYKLSMQERLDCPRSYADEDNTNLLCECGGTCDGTLYDCCLWDNPRLESRVMYHYSFEE